VDPEFPDESEGDEKEPPLDLEGEE